jgi:stearoyl-CoA desaturase (delta-9 desaturase)
MVGIKKVLFEGAELYRAEAKVQATLDRYGHGTPDDWLERNIYTPHTNAGIVVLLAVQLLLFGPIGLTIWAVQMIWIPFFAAGIINGVGHYWGYRNFACEDASTNIVPWGILIGGEELHNNHHANATSAKLSSKWYEFDIGWLYIRILETFGLAHVKHVAPVPRFGAARPVADASTLEAVIANRHDVLASYARSLHRVCADEIAALRRQAPLDGWRLANLRDWLFRDTEDMAAPEREALARELSQSPVLQKVYAMRDELTALWGRSMATREQLVQQLQDWCQRAEASGIAPLAAFSQRLRSYV